MVLDFEPQAVEPDDSKGIERESVFWVTTAVDQSYRDR
jgi:hypothetical protein